jgi:hypothetical protein
LNEQLRNTKLSIEHIEAVLENHREMHREKAMKLEEHAELIERQGE